MALKTREIVIHVEPQPAAGVTGTLYTTINKTRNGISGHTFVRHGGLTTKDRSI